jgi:hypothetical protein
MRTSNSDRLTAATSEQLLDGGPGPAGLQQLLAAAAGPGTASELTGETAAVAAFVGAPLETPLPSAPRRPSMLSTALSKILAAKALAAVVLLAGATGGVALAANASSGPSSADETVTSTETADPEPADDENTDSDADSDENAAEPDATKAPSPEPSIIGLCRAWAAGATDNPGKAAENPAFRSLVEAAGSAEDVTGFCAVRESVDQHGKSATAPGRAEDEDATTEDTTEDKAGPPTAAPGNPDHLTGPPADRATKDEDEADSKDAEETESKGKGDEAKQGAQGGGAEHRPAG